MKFKHLTTFFLVGTLTTMGILISQRQTEANPQIRFICNEGYDKATNRRLPTTYAWYKGEKRALIRYTRPIGNYSPLERCNAISPRFQEAYDNGSLVYLTNSKMNGQSVICSSKEHGGACITLLMTLRPEDNPLQFLAELKDTLYGRATGPVPHSSGIQQMYYKIDIEEALRNAPVESE